MKQAFLGAALFTTALLAPAHAHADGDPIRVLVRGPLEATAVAAAIADELGVATSIVTDDDACNAPCAAITIDAAHVASIHLRGATGVQVRTIELPTGERAATDVVALVVGNLARDESAALLAAMSTPTPTPTPDPTAPVIIPPTPAASAATPARRATPPPDPERRPRRHGFSLGFIPGLAIDIAGEGGFAVDLVAGARRHITGMSVSGVGSIAGDVQGTQIAGAVTVAGKVDGGQVAGALAVANEVGGSQIAGALAASGPVRGAQIAGAAAIATDVRGTQIGGAVTIARAVRGAQIAGAVAVALEVHGTQIAGAATLSQGHAGTQVAGAVNVAAGRVRGAQVAPFNIAGRVDGVQIGVVNVANAGDGVSLGLINIVRGGRTELEATLDDHAVGALVLRHGSRRWHNVYGVAARAERSLLDEDVTDDDMWMYGLGFGPSWRSGATTVDVEAMAWQVFYGDDFTQDLDLLTQLRVVVGHDLGPASLVVGGALNTYITTDETRDGYGARIAPGTMPPPMRAADDVLVQIWPSVFAGLRI